MRISASKLSACDSPFSCGTTRIQASPFIPNKSSVRGFVYDVKSGKLEEVKTAVGVR